MSIKYSSIHFTKCFYHLEKANATDSELALLKQQNPFFAFAFSFTKKHYVYEKLTFDRHLFPKIEISKS